MCIANIILICSQHWTASSLPAFEPKRVCHKFPEFERDRIAVSPPLPPPRHHGLMQMRNSSKLPTALASKVNEQVQFVEISKNHNEYSLRDVCFPPSWSLPPPRLLSKRQVILFSGARSFSFPGLSPARPADHSLHPPPTSSSASRFPF